MEIKVKEITPGKAEEMLRANIKNRALKLRSLQKIIDQMNNGEWKELTGETIKISKNGTLLDGQHRLQALIETKKTYKFIVVEGLDEEVYEVIDTGKNRQAGDALHILGVKSYFNVSAIIRSYLYLREGKVVSNISDSVATNHRIVEAYKKEPQ